MKQLPEFLSEDEERAFWAEHDSADCLDWSQAKPVVFPHLKLSTVTRETFENADAHRETANRLSP